MHLLYCKYPTGLLSHAKEGVFSVVQGHSLMSVSSALPSPSPSSFLFSCLISLLLCQVLGTAACTVVSFDFSGSGMSEGDWVTLGYFEQHDVADVLAYLRSNGE